MPLVYNWSNMAKLTRDDILHLAKLTKLSLSDDEVEEFTKEMSDILGYVEQLQQVDIAGLEPTYQVTGLKNVTRKDVVINYGATPEELLGNAPATEDGLIKVKRVL
jgi:aspartyl-tRNA(Asn)/glutamyl-tRNA(Gln) amidotransferase subunit C